MKVLDDFLFIGDDLEECKFALDSFRSLCGLLGVPLSEKKTVEPTRLITFLGYQIDMEAKVISIPREKIVSYKEHAQSLINKDFTTLREIRSMVGQLGFVTNVIQGGKTFLRRLHDLTKRKHNNNQIIKVSKSAKLDLTTWVTFLSYFNGKALLTSKVKLTSEEINFFSDSCESGFGAVLGKEYIQGVFPPKWKHRGIQFLELFPIFIMVELFAPQLAHKSITFYSDNIAVVGSINKLSSRNKNVMRLLRPMVLQLMIHNIKFDAKHIRGVNN